MLFVAVLRAVMLCDVYCCLLLLDVVPFCYCAVFVFVSCLFVLSLLFLCVCDCFYVLEYCVCFVFAVSRCVRCCLSFFPFLLDVALCCYCFALLFLFDRFFMYVCPFALACSCVVVVCC